ncbi:beige protein-like 1 [Teratosphaeriaceae sp. CCFEE 6253]|nr:beige protein-like 1 [Teratosphaeriaceae sp. CCFEE 6253]
MALHVGQLGRPRTSVNASRGLDAAESESAIAVLLRKLLWQDSSSAAEEAARLTGVAAELGEALGNEILGRDTFRHGAGFEAVLKAISKLGESCPELWMRAEQSVTGLMGELLTLLGIALRDHCGNQKYFGQHVDGWTSIRASVEALRGSLIESDDTTTIDRSLRHIQHGLLNLATDDINFSQCVLENGMVDSKVPDSVSSVTVELPQAAGIAVTVALLATSRSSAAVPSTTIVLRALARLCAGSIRNIFALWQADVLTTAMHVALDQTLDQGVRDAAHDLTMQLATFGLSNLDELSWLFREASTSATARALLLDTMQQSKGPSFVQFDLARHGYCSIELPSLPRAFPPSTGYALTAWLRMDKFDPSSHTTLFGAYDASQSCFILIYLEQDSHQLILQTSIRSSRPSVRFKSTRFVPGKWYHLALVQRRATADPRQSPAVLFINGEFAEQVKCGYPESPPQHDEKSTPVSPNGNTAQRTKPVQAFFGTPHDLATHVSRDEVQSKWSLASAHLYASPISDEFVAVQHRLGPGYTGNYQDCLGPLLTYRASAELHRYNELLHPEKSDKSDIITATESRGSEVVAEIRLLLSFTASAVVNLDGTGDGVKVDQHTLNRKAYTRYQMLAQKARAVAINLAVPTINEAFSRSYGTGVLTGDPVVAAPKPMDDATWCLAGCLPLVVRLLESASTMAAVMEAVRIWFECVNDNWRISEAMEKGSGFGLLMLIIREKLGLDTSMPSSGTPKKPSPALSLEERQRLPGPLLRLILEFVGYRSLKPEDSMLVNPMAYRVLLVDFDTWRRCDFETTQLYFQQFVHFTSQNRHQAFNAKRLVRMRVVKKLIEALKNENILEEAAVPLLKAVKALVDNSNAGALYKDLAMYVAWGLQDERATAPRPMRNLASVVNFRQTAISWASRHARASRPRYVLSAVDE